MMEDLKALKDEFLGKGGEDPEFIKKLSDLENFVMYRKKLPTNPYQHGNSNVSPDPSRHEISVQQNPPFPGMFPPGVPPPGMAPPGIGMPPPPYGPPGMYPFQDPMLSEMNNMLS